LSNSVQQLDLSGNCGWAPSVESREAVDDN
jgi:hypothetical protein